VVREAARPSVHPSSQSKAITRQPSYAATAATTASQLFTQRSRLKSRSAILFFSHTGIIMSRNYLNTTEKQNKFTLKIRKNYENKLSFKLEKFEK